MQKVLFIGLVWPEPTSSAAGVRILQLIQLFQRAGQEVVFVSAASKSAHSFPLAAHGVREEAVLLNDDSFDTFVRELQPDTVVFDRFITEEQFGWRVREACPSALTILDTEDLHFLRAARQEAAKKQTPINYYNETTKRELASIYRSDLSLMISQVEVDLLTNEFNIPAGQLYYIPFLEESLTDEQVQAWKSFAERKDLMFIGNFLHEPNWHTVQVLKTKLWPLLKDRLPGVQLHIYGAYATQKVQQLHQPKDRFFIMGRAEDARETMSNYRLLVAPIQFGAGAKGKLIDAMQSGTPSVTSSIGAESMTRGEAWNGFIEDDLSAFAEKVVLLYKDAEAWALAQAAGRNIIRANYDRASFEAPFLAQLDEMRAELPVLRQRNIVGEILRTQQFNSSKYMSLWIAEKAKNLVAQPKAE